MVFGGKGKMEITYHLQLQLEFLALLKQRTRIHFYAGNLKW